jgi:hypothetical protein
MMSLLFCIGARGGDLAALQLQETELSLDPGTVSLANLTLRIRIKSYKGNTSGRGAAQRHTIRTFQRKENFMLDPIVLMIRDLRKRGLFLGTTEEILKRAKAHPRRIIVIGAAADEDAKRPVFIHLGYSQNYGDDGEQPVHQRGMVAKTQQLFQIAGVVGDLKGLGTHALRRGAASDLSRAPEDTWRTGASDHVAYLLGHSGEGNGRNKLVERYADAATEDASRARESNLPLRQPGGDGTTWTRTGSHPLEMVKTMRDLGAVRDLDASEVLPGATPAALHPTTPALLLLHLFK